MKIAIDIRNIGRRRTGDETVFVNLIRALAKTDRSNSYELLTGDMDESTLSRVRTILGVADMPNFRVVPIGSTNKFVWNMLVLPKYLRRHHVDIYHTQYIIPFFLPRDVRVVTHIHDVSFKAYPNLIARMDLFFLNALIPRSIRRSDAIVAVSQFTKDEIVKYYPGAQSKIHVVPNAVDDAFFGSSVSETERNRVRTKYSLPETFILYVGTLQPRKNIPALISAFSLIKDRLPGVKLVLAGNRQGHHYDQQIDSILVSRSLEEDVVFPGYVDAQDMRALYTLARVFAFPSKYEGFGIPILEAMVTGTPAVVSDIPVHREVANDAALFVKVSSIDSFAEMLYNACTSDTLRDDIERRGRARAESYSWESSARLLRAVYSGLRR